MVSGGGVDHKNVAAGLEVPDCVLDPDGRDAVAEVADDHASKPLSRALFELALLRPSTRLSKSSASPFASSSPLTRFVGARLDIKSALFADVELVEESSCSFLVCSASIRDDKLLINVMNP